MVLLTDNLPLILRTKLDDPSLCNGIFTDFAPTLVRRINEGTREDLWE